MYEIKKDGVTLELQDSLSWVRDQKNGVLISCDEKDGVGILVGSYHKNEDGNEIFQKNSVIYSVVGKPQLRDFEFVEANEIKWYPVSAQQRADIDYVAIMTGVEL